MKFELSVEPIWKRDALTVMLRRGRRGGRGGFLLDLELAFEDQQSLFLVFDFAAADPTRRSPACSGWVAVPFAPAPLLQMAAAPRKTPPLLLV